MTCNVQIHLRASRAPGNIAVEYSALGFWKRETALKRGMIMGIIHVGKGNVTVFPSR